MKIRTAEAELFHEDGQTDMRKLMVAFSNFSNAPKKPAQQIYIYIYTHIYLLCSIYIYMLIESLEYINGNQSHPSKCFKHSRHTNQLQ